ncbi:MAG TPA: hypothetical protein ENJ95_16845 [Bacteroidetes bacterium]|nr:hypothetical protein [Bacteroidota bacterium]
MNLKFTAIFLLFSLSVSAATRYAPQNDKCSQAIAISGVRDYCSSPRQFTNEGAGPSQLEGSGCFSSIYDNTDKDVWFKFKAIANTVNISVIGAIRGNPKGTLQNPQFVLYWGSCSTGFMEVGCRSDAMGYNIVETFVHDLAIGGTYYLRVGGRNGNVGSFQLCIKNFNPVPSPSADCSSAVVLCDKSGFTVPNIEGAGNDRYELPAGMCLKEETSSAWYKWTCDQPGSLTMTLTPVNPSDDIDFVVFQLPFGLDECSLKLPLRCMASGENQGQPLSSWRRCTGATGMSSRSVDLYEDGGCNEMDNNFVAALQMEAGASYALIINNFHNTGNGFSVEFGGTGTFKGPTAHFVVNKLKINQNQDLWVKNRSSFEGGIKKWEWNFGVDAKPQTATGKGPHKVNYSSSGKKSISLAIETGNGCQVTKVRQITVLDPPPPPPEPAVAKVEKDEKPKPAQQTPPSSPASPNGGVRTPKPPATPINKVDKKPAPEEKQIPAAPPTADTVFTPVTYDVKYTATIYFASDSAALDRDDIEILTKTIALVRQHPEYVLVVEGHTNNIPSDEYCNKLATERADVVIAWFRRKGVGEERIMRKIYGKKKVHEKEKTKFKNRKVYQKAVVRLMARE